MITSRGFPWPPVSEARAVIVRPGPFLPPTAELWARSEGLTRRAAVAARRSLSQRWEAADVAVREGAPAEQILEEVARWRPHAVVIGWRGHGTFRRLLMGSVSRAVVRGAAVPVLVARRAVPKVAQVVIGFDDSSASSRAVRFLARCTPVKAGGITLVTVVPKPLAPSHSLLRGISSDVHAAIAARHAKDRARAEARQAKAARTLRAAGWRVHCRIETGAPLHELLRRVSGARADLLVVGARARAGLRTGALGSTAEGAVSRSPVPVLVVP